MAKFYPSSISQIDNISESEKNIFDRLKILDDSYYIFHSASWNGKCDGECDFIIFNEFKGFIALEVKDGKIDFDGKRWTSIDQQGKPCYIKDPVKQAQDTMRAIRRVYQEKYNSSFGGIQTWGVCFSECHRGSGFKTLDINDANILDFCESENVNLWVSNLFKFNEDNYGVRKLSDEERINFISLFDKELQIPLAVRRVTLEQQRKLASADRMQEYLLDLFEDKSKIALHGAAGTGKTWIAMKKAIRLASKGNRVLFTCFSRGLCEFLKSKLSSFSNIHVTTFYSFAYTVIREYIAVELKRFVCEEEFFNCITDLLKEGADIKMLSAKRKYSGGRNLDLRIHGAILSLASLSYGEDYDTVLSRYEDSIPIDIVDILSLLMPDGTGKDSFYNVRIPLALSQVFENEHICLEKFSYDAVIIDEGQDFHINWCNSLKNLFERYNNRTVYVFYDENQTIFRRERELPIRELISRTDHNNYIFYLRHNIRNIDDIHEFAIAKTGLAAKSFPLGISGVLPVEYEFSREGEAVDFTGNVLSELIKSHRIERESITILSNRSIDSSIFSDHRRAGEYSLVVADNEKAENSIRFRAIHEFRGLESEVVILILHKRKQEFEDKKRYLSEELLYVGFTRARHLLYVITVIS